MSLSFWCLHIQSYNYINTHITLYINKTVLSTVNKAKLAGNSSNSITDGTALNISPKNAEAKAESEVTV